MCSYKSAHANKVSGDTNDIWITPPGVIEVQLSMIESREDDLWFDPFKNTGAYYNAFPSDNKDYTEILEGKDFFDYAGEPDIICTNPPYSLFASIYEKVIEMSPRVVSFVMSQGSLTRPRRLAMKTAGYSLTKMYHFDVARPNKRQQEAGYKPWMSSIIVQWERLDMPTSITQTTFNESPYPFCERSENYERLAIMSRHKEFNDSVNLLHTLLAEMHISNLA